jgi:hypothetical protein
MGELLYKKKKNPSCNINLKKFKKLVAMTVCNCKKNQDLRYRMASQEALYSGLFIGIHYPYPNSDSRKSIFLLKVGKKEGPDQESIYIQICITEAWVGEIPTRRDRQWQ